MNRFSMNDKMNELEILLEEAFANPARIGDFYARMLSVDLYIIIRDDGVAGGKKILETGAEVQIMNYIMTDGTPFIPVFTSLSEMQKTITEESGYMSVNGGDLFNLIKGTDVVFNPMSEYALHLPPDELAKIIDHFSTVMSKDSCKSEC